MQKIRLYFLSIHKILEGILIETALLKNFHTSNPILGHYCQAIARPNGLAKVQDSLECAKKPSKTQQRQCNVGKIWSLRKIGLFKVDKILGILEFGQEITQLLLSLDFCQCCLHYQSILVVNSQFSLNVKLPCQLIGL